MDMTSGVVRYKMSAICLLASKLLDDREFFRKTTIVVDGKEINVILQC